MDVPKKALPNKENIQEAELPDDLEPEAEKLKEEKSEMPQRGEKTPERNLYGAVSEERQMRREAEKRAEELELRIKELERTAYKQLQPIVQDDEVFSDEGKTLKRTIDTLASQFKSVEEQLSKERLFTQYPEIREVSDDFEDFRKEYDGFPLEKVAKLFLAEKGITKSPARKGLEKANGGNKAPVSSGMSEDELKRMRESNPRKYLKIIKEGKIHFDL